MEIIPGNLLSGYLDRGPTSEELYELVARDLDIPLDSQKFLELKENVSFDWDVSSPSSTMLGMRVGKNACRVIRPIELRVTISCTYNVGIAIASEISAPLHFVRCYTMDESNKLFIECVYDLKD